MRRLQLNQVQITFKEGCTRYLDNCRIRGLRDGTINHYKQSYTQFDKWFDSSMQISNFTQDLYNQYVLYLTKTIPNKISVNAYLRDLITTVHYWQSQGWCDGFKMSSVKTDETHIETYTDDELHKLLTPPDKRNCTYTEYQCWVMTNLLFATGIRQRSLDNLKIGELDLQNNIIYINITKNHKQLIIPINHSLSTILADWLQIRQGNADDYLFTNVYGAQLVKSTSYHMLFYYNKGRGVETTGIHRYRHTMAKQWILNGGNVVTLSKLLGHSSLAITQNYINLLVSDLAVEVCEINLLDKFTPTSKTRKKL